MRKTFFLDLDFGLDSTKSRDTIGAHFTIDQVKSTFPKAYERLTKKGPAFGVPLNDAGILACTYFDIAWLEAVASGQGGGQPIDGFLSSNNHVVIPHGTYLTRIPTEYSSGEYFMQGPGYTDPGNDSVNTKLRIDHAGWLGDRSRRNMLVSGSWGRATNVGHVEGSRFVNFRLDGAQEDVPYEVFESYGMMSWKPGEVTDHDRIYFEQFRTSGAIFYAPTPTVLGNITAFECVESGIRFAGGWGGTVVVNMLSGDNNGCMFDMVTMDMDGVFAEAGGCIKFNMIKNESMVATAGRTWRGQIVGVCRGQFAVEANVHMAVGTGRIPAMFIVDSRLSNGHPQSSWLEVKGKGYRYNYLIHDTRLGRAVPTMGEYAGGKVEYYTDTAEYVHRGRVFASDLGKSTYRSEDLEMIPGSQNYRHIILGPPQQPDTVYLNHSNPPPPQTCEWVLGEWGEYGPCVDGFTVRERPYVSSVPGCTPTSPRPAAQTDTQICNEPTDPTLIFEQENINIGSSFSNVVSWNDVTVIELKGFVFKGGEYQRLGWESENDPLGISIKKGSDGFFFRDYQRNKISGSFTANAAPQDIRLEFKSPVDIGYFGGRPRGVGIDMTVQKMSVYSNIAE